MRVYQVGEITGVRTIGVIMFGLLGDVFIRTPILKALREIYPEANIIAIVDPIGRQVLKDNTFCDDIITINRDKKNRLNYQVNKIKSFFKVRRAKIDLIIDFYNGGSSYFLTYASGAKYKLGHYNSNKKNIYNIDNSKCKELENINSYYQDSMSVLYALDTKEFSLKPTFTILEETYKKMSIYLSSLAIDVSRVYLLNFGSGGEEKLLDENKYAELVKYIYDKYNYMPLIISNPGQEYLQENFIQKYLSSSEIPYVKLEALTLQEIGVLVQNTAFLITPDTGLMHLAMAFDRYIYAIFTYTSPSLVDPNHEKFLAVYDKFEENELFKTQNIRQKRLAERIDTLFDRMKESSI